MARKFVVLIELDSWRSAASAARQESEELLAANAAGPRPGQHVRDIVGRHAEEVTLMYVPLSHTLPPAPRL